MSGCSSWPTAPGLTITTGHFPPGTSKWNTIEHRLFSYISRNWRRQPLATLAVIVMELWNYTIHSVIV